MSEGVGRVEEAAVVKDPGVVSSEPKKLGKFRYLVRRFCGGGDRSREAMRHLRGGKQGGPNAEDRGPTRLAIVTPDTSRRAAGHRNGGKLSWTRPGGRGEDGGS